MTSQEGRGGGDQVFTGRDTFDFGTSRSDMERMMGARNPFVVTSNNEDEQPFIATEKGQQWVAGAVVSVYMGGPIVAGLIRKRKRARARRQRNADQ